MKLPRCKLWGFYWWAVLGPNHFCWSETEPRRKPLVWGLQEDSGWLLCWNQDCLPRIKFLKSLVALLICLLQQKKKKPCMWNICKSLTAEIHNILYFYWCHQLLSCLLESVQSQTPGRKEESHYLSHKKMASPWELEDFPAGWGQ